MNYAFSPRSVAKKRRIARHGRSSSEYWKPGIHINNIPCYRQRLQCSSNPRRTSCRNRRWLQKADRKPHQLVLPLLLLRGDLVGMTAVVVVSSSRVCLGFSSVVVVGLKLSWSDESVGIVWENRRLRDRLLLSHLSFGFWFWGKDMVLIFGFLRRERSYGFLSFLLETCRHCWNLSFSVSVSLCVRVFSMPHLSLLSLCTTLFFFFYFDLSG